MTFVPGSVSCGTMRLYDLANAFTAALETVSLEAYQQLAFPVDFTCDGLRAIDEGPSAEFWNTEAADEFIGMLTDTLNEHAPDGYYFGAHEGDGADFGFWETKEGVKEREWRELQTALETAKDASSGRTVHLAESSVRNGCIGPDCDRFAVFAFGAHGGTYVAVPYETNPYHGLDLSDALESGAETLLKVAPGHFYEPDFAAARHELRADGMLSADTVNVCPHTGKDYRDPSALDSDTELVFEHATSDLTYTESGYLLSHEWIIVSENMDRAALLAFARGE